MKENLAITPRNLGSITLAKYCPACLWYLLRMRFHPPFNSFGGGIFKVMEKAEKAIVGYYLETQGSLPKEFDPFCDCVERIDYPKSYKTYRYTHKSGVVLYGEPDEIFRLKSSGLCIGDHKTAKAKGVDDPFHGQYEVQVVGYGDIAQNGLRLGKVTRGGLFYWDAQLDKVLENPAGFYKKGELYVPFKPKPLEVDINFSILDPLIKEAKKVWNLSSPPAGKENCKDCEKLAFLFAIDEDADNSDQQVIKEHAAFEDVRRTASMRRYQRQTERHKVRANFNRYGEGFFEDDGMTANWEFPELEFPSE